MAKTRISCPNCKQPIMADIDQLFDVGVDPSAKQRLLSGGFNITHCPVCGYEGFLATPIVYHDPQKELLLTFIPPELNLPRDEQERLIGAQINQIVNRLPQEGRKGYLLRPQAVLTLKGLVERVLEGDGITREMIQAQQQKLTLIQRMLDASDDDLVEIARQEDAQIDGEFFNLISRLVESATLSGDQESAQRIAEIQQKLLPVTTAGKELQERSKDVEAAMQLLQSAGKELTREKLLDIVIHAPNNTQVDVITSLARPGMDYVFFQLLSERIDRSRGTGRDRLIELREHLLELTQQIDTMNEARLARSKQILETVLKADNVTQAVEKILPAIDEVFEYALQAELESARKAGDLGKIAKLQEITKVIEEASAPPPEVVMIEELLELENDDSRAAWLDAHRNEVTPEFLESLTALLVQAQSNENDELLARLQAVYRSALRYSMEKNIS